MWFFDLIRHGNSRLRPVLFSLPVVFSAFATPVSGDNLTQAVRTESEPPASYRTNPDGSPKTHPGQNGPLNEREMRLAKAAWTYFERFTMDETGLANSAGNYPSTTMWDTASYLSGLVSAYELGLIDKRTFDLRSIKVIRTLKNLKLFRGELPNKAYHTKTAEMVDYANKKGEIGFSGNDLGRLLIWLRIMKDRYPYLAASVDQIPLQWNFCNVVDQEGVLYGSGLDRDGEVVYRQEGRLGYEEYAAKGFGLWGFDTAAASYAAPFNTINIFGVDVPYDSRDQRIFKSQNFTVTEGFILDGLEMNWDLPGDGYSDDFLHTNGWRAEFANRIFMVQQRRFEELGIITARTEHQVKGKPYFVYDTIFGSGHPWNTMTPRGVYEPDLAAVAGKGAIGLWALWDNPYSDLLFDTVSDLYDPERGIYEGIYENGNGIIEVQTANNNGIILAALLYKVQGKLVTHRTNSANRWFEKAYQGYDTRKRKCYPKKKPKTDCGCSACGRELALETRALHFDEYQYCEPVAPRHWAPGCAACITEPAVRNCRTRRFDLSYKPMAPGSLCPADAADLSDYPGFSPLPARTTGETTGQINGQINGQTTGQINGQINGQSTGPKSIRDTSAPGAEAKPETGARKPESRKPESRKPESRKPGPKKPGTGKRSAPASLRPLPALPAVPAMRKGPGIPGIRGIPGLQGQGQQALKEIIQ